MKTEILPANQPGSIQRAITTIQAGGLVAFPTDTVYGVSASVHDETAIKKLYKVKQRDSSLAIPVLLGNTADLEIVAQSLGNMAMKLGEAFWPGPLTLVVPKHHSLPQILSPYHTIGVRQPDHPIALALLKQTGPLAVTSANISGAANTHTAREVIDQLGDRIALILDGGRTPGGFPSTVVDCTAVDPVILRLGPITLEELRAVL